MFWVEKMLTGRGERPSRFGVKRLQDCPARISNFFLRTSNQKRRTRRLLLLVVTATFVGEKPMKSVSRYPRTSVPLNLESSRRPNREFCIENRNSESLPAVALLKGILPKFVPIPLPTFRSRTNVVKSRKP